MLTDSLARASLAHLPTPIDALPRLSEFLGGPELFVKRDDQTGLATGGNKARKLEFLVADALARGAHTLVTTGAPQSNHARQTAAAAAKYGLRAVLALKGEPPARIEGNLLIDEILGAEVRWSGDEERDAFLTRVVADEEAAGRRPYLVPYGGSSPVGAAGYVDAMEELAAQMANAAMHFDAIVFPTSSGGTQAGLALGRAALGIEAQLLGISVDKPAPQFRPQAAELANRTAELLGLSVHLAAEDILVNDDYIGGGYAVVGPPEREAIRLLGRTEGLLADPVYTGRALAGLIDLIRQGYYRPGQRVLFWHTGGTAGIFGFGPALLAHD